MLRCNPVLCSKNIKKTNRKKILYTAKRSHNNKKKYNNNFKKNNINVRPKNK